MGGDNLIYVFAAYTVIWLIAFGYVYTIGSRQKQLQKEIEALKSALQGMERPTEDVSIPAHSSFH